MEPFISSDDLAAFLDETVDPVALLTGIALDGACQMVRDDIGQNINLERSRIERHDGHSREGIILRQKPVIEVLQVFEDDTELIEGDDYVVGTGPGIVWRRGWSMLSWHHGGWSFGRQNVEVIYDCGWAITEDDVVPPDSSDTPVVERVPATIRIVALEAAARVFRAPMLSAVAAGITGEGMGPYSYTVDLGAAQSVVAAGLLPEESERLDRYRQLV